MVDNYTKAVLTVIAAALALLAVRPVSQPGPAVAQQGLSCGLTYMKPCYIKNDDRDALFVTTAPGDSVSVINSRLSAFEVRVVR
jgi:hypothetical protein